LFIFIFNSYFHPYGQLYRRRVLFNSYRFFTDETIGLHLVAAHGKSGKGNPATLAARQVYFYCSMYK